MNLGRQRPSNAAIAGVLLFAVIVFVFFRSSDPARNRLQRLADGSTLELRQIALATNFAYSYRPGNRLQQFLAPIMPEFIKSRFWPQGSASFGTGGTATTNLWVVTLYRHPARSAALQPARL